MQPGTPSAPRPPAAAVNGRATPSAFVTPSLEVIKPDRFGADQARHLLWRAGFGASPEQIKTLVGWGPIKSVDYLLNYKGVAFEPDAPETFDRNIIRPANSDERGAYEKARRSGDEEAVARFRAMKQEAERFDRVQMKSVQHWWLKRMIETPRPLEEKLTLFWHSLLATSYRTIEDSYHMYAQNRMFRAHATGNFGELLSALIRDPAMLAYLDNNDSRKGRPNENLARELMELFTLGVGNYTEKDIKEGARSLTGYTFEDDAFRFAERNHDAGPKSILGKAGTLDGDGFVKAILQHPACPRYLSQRLYRFFVSDYPTGRKELDSAAARVISGMASTLSGSGYELKPVLRRLFLSEHFYSPMTMNEQIKSPVELVVGAVRSLNTPARDIGVLADACALMGQNIFFPPSVKGWEGGRSWINTATLFIRQNILCFLLTGRTPQGYDALAKVERFDAEALLTQLGVGEGGGGVTEAIRELLKFTLGTASERNTTLLSDHVAKNDGGNGGGNGAGAKGALSPEMTAQCLLLISAMPEYQLC